MLAVYEKTMAITCGDTGLFDPRCPRPSSLVYIVGCVEKNTVTSGLLLLRLCLLAQKQRKGALAAPTGDGRQCITALQERGCNGELFFSPYIITLTSYFAGGDS